MLPVGDDMTKKFALPQATRNLLTELIRRRDEATERLELAVATVRATLGVPADYVIMNLEQGFVPAPGEEPMPNDEGKEIPG